MYWIWPSSSTIALETWRRPRRYSSAWLAISGPDTDTADTAAAWGNLGLIYRKRGGLDRAEEMHQKSLAIEEKLGRQEGMASDYSNLGLIYEKRGELDRAEEMYQKALAINEKLGRQEGMAINYGNLGLIYKAREELDRAEEMYQKAWLSTRSWAAKRAWPSTTATSG